MGKGKKEKSKQVSKAPMGQKINFKKKKKAGIHCPVGPEGWGERGYTAGIRGPDGLREKKIKSRYPRPRWAKK